MSERPLHVTRTFLPPRADYERFMERVWANNHVTNSGELMLELETRLADWLGVPALLLTANGTLALQLAIRALGLSGEIITTPYSYVASTNAILWEHCEPVFVDIDPTDMCLDPQKVEAAITSQTTGILAVHVYGNPCRHDELAAIADRHGLRLIYDGAHGFGTRVDGSSILRWGDVSTLSLHATKLYHTVEGGAVIARNVDTAQRLYQLRAFGHYGDDYQGLGINAKMSEMHAAMGLALLPHADDLLRRRRELHTLYDEALGGLDLTKPLRTDGVDHNHAYYPVLLPAEVSRDDVLACLAQEGIHPRKYFWPALNRLPHHTGAPCPVAEDAVERVLCLPLFHEMRDDEVARVCHHLREALKETA